MATTTPRPMSWDRRQVGKVQVSQARTLVAIAAIFGSKTGFFTFSQPWDFNYIYPFLS